jgi:hypothetical protein
VQRERTTAGRHGDMQVQMTGKEARDNGALSGIQVLLHRQWEIKKMKLLL